MALERLVFYSSLPCGRAKQIVPALFSKILWDACENHLLIGPCGFGYYLASCATPKPPQAFHNTDNTALVVGSLEGRTCQMLQPTVSVREDSDKLLAKAMKLSQHQTAVVILENYAESRICEQFRDPGSLWFVCLRSLGYFL
jgi:hypothetical protein